LVVGLVCGLAVPGVGCSDGSTPGAGGYVSCTIIGLNADGGSVSDQVCFEISGATNASTQQSCALPP
jgi:hypothetical protein